MSETNTPTPGYESRQDPDYQHKQSIRSWQAKREQKLKEWGLWDVFGDRELTVPDGGIDE